MYERRSERRATEGEDQGREKVSSRAAMHGSKDSMKREVDSLTCLTEYDLPRLQTRVPYYLLSCHLWIETTRDGN